jgi:hypothetical protein
MLHCQRWEHVELRMPSEHLYLIQGEMPLLQKLTFGYIFLSGHATLTLFDRAPKLTAIVLKESFVLNPAVTLPWEQLTHLEADCLYEHECIDILRAAPRLAACTVSVCPSNEDVVATPIPTHMHLRHMVLLVSEDDDDPEVRLWMMLDCLTLPALRTLKLSEPGITLGSLKAFISRSHCALEELRIVKSSVSGMTYREALPSVGTITVAAGNE